MSEPEPNNLNFIGMILLLSSFCVICFIFAFTFAKQGQLPTINDLVFGSAIGMATGGGMIFIDGIRDMRKARKEKKVDSNVM